jgi:hypothetical protein
VSGIIACLLYPTLACSQSTLEIPAPPVKMGSLAYLDARNGFRDVTFGDAITKYPDMVKDSTSGALTCYRRPTDDLVVGEGTLASIHYCFYKARLSHVLLKATDHSNTKAVLQTLQHAYGAGIQPNPYMENYVWMGDKVWLSYHGNAVVPQAAILFTSQPLRAEQEADEQHTAKKAAAGL